MSTSQSAWYRAVTHLILIGTAFFWGINPMVMKVGMQELHPVPFNALRLSVGLIAALIQLLVSRSWQPVRREDLPRFLVVAVAGFFLFQFCYSFGVDYTSASVGSIILGTLPIQVAIITKLFSIETLSLNKTLGILATFGGVVFIALGKHGGLGLAGTYVFGVVLLAVAEFGYGVYTVFLRPLTDRYSIYQIIFIVMSVALTPFILMSLPAFGLAAFTGLQPVTWFSAAFSGIFALALGNTLWSFGIKRIGSTNASVYGNLPPVFGILAGILVLNETLSTMQVLGALIILGGVALVNKKPADPQAGRQAETEGVSE
ncbi:MAG: DMT family transporter [Spirochaetota bacterium]